MMSNPPQYYGMPNGFPPTSNGQTLQHQQQQFHPILPGVRSPSKGSVMPNGPPPVMTADPLHLTGTSTPLHPMNDPLMMETAVAAPYPMSHQQRIVGNWVTTNGNSATSSRTSSPAMGSKGVQHVLLAEPSGQQAPAATSAVGVRGFLNVKINNNNLPPMVSSQSQPPPSQGQQSGQARPPVGVANNGYSHNPNNNWSIGNIITVGGNVINTPPKSASGLSTPLNASTPTLTGPLLGRQDQPSVQDLNLNAPPTQQKQRDPHLQQSQQTSSMSNGSSEQPLPQTNGPSIPTNVTGTQESVQLGMPRPTYGHLPPPLNQQFQQQLPQNLPQLPMRSSAPNLLNQTTGTGSPNGAFNSSITQQATTQQRLPGMGILPPTGISAPTNLSQPINKRPMYPSSSKGVLQPLHGQPHYQMNTNYSGMGQQPALPTQGEQQHQQQHSSQLQNQQQPHHQQQQQQQAAFASPGGYPIDASGNVVRSGFNRMWGNNTVDLMQNRHILPTDRVRPPTIHLVNPFQESINCHPDIFRCTLTKIPESSALLHKSRLPLGVLIHPFRDLNNLPVISCNTIVRCRACRTYINPFVFFVDSKKWKCNLCYRVNELPEEFQYDPLTKTYGDPTRRPEIKSSTIEFIAPSEYMLRPPQPAIYLFLLDVSSLAQQSGYLYTVCNTLIEHLDNLPGDARTQVGFIAYNSAIHFYNIAEGYNQPHEVTVLDVEDAFLPYPDNLLVNLKECKELIKELLKQLPKRFEHTHDNHNALGAALQVAFKLMSASGGRVTVFQTCLPNHGPGSLQSREDPNNRSSKDVAHLGPATDFYKRLALECSGQQIAVDLFLLNSQYCDLATISGISKFSGGCIHHIPLYSESKPQLVKTLRKSFERYLTRKIGFEAVMRVRCTRGLAIHTFHGNFFVRSTDLLSLPNVNPDAGFGMQITYEESLAECKTVCFQAALLYTSSKAERRIRVHTLCIPVTASLTEVMYSADAQCIVGLLSKMAVDRSLSSSLSDARDAFINATVDIFTAFKIAQNLPQNSTTIVAPENLGLLPLYILALLKHPAFRTGTSTRLDDRVFAMCEMKSLPSDQLIRYIYPDFYVLDCLFAPIGSAYVNEGQKFVPPRLQLSSEKLDSRSMFLLDCGAYMFIYIGSNVASSIVRDILGYNSVAEIPDFCVELPSRETAASEALLNFLDAINEEKPYSSYVQVMRDTSQFRSTLVEKFVDDRNPNSLSYYEFLQHLRTQIK